MNSAIGKSHNESAKLCAAQDTISWRIPKEALERMYQLNKLVPLGFAASSPRVPSGGIQHQNIRRNARWLLRYAN